MAARKNPHNGCFGTPPSVNFFSSVDEDISETVDKDAQEKELSEKLKQNSVNGSEREGSVPSKVGSVERKREGTFTIFFNGFLIMYIFGLDFETL